MAEGTSVSLKRLEQYLSKFAERGCLITQAPNSSTSLYVVIPVFKEKQLLNVLRSLVQCELPANAFEVILVFNSSAKHEVGIELNWKARQEVEEWKNTEVPPFQVYCIEENALDPKEAGVGLARKIGMDEALRRAVASSNPNAVIACLDADCTVSENYLTAIESYFAKHLEMEAACLQFEHPLEGKQYADEIYEAILLYELHLRYFKWAMQFIGLPYAYYTVGSSMAVRILAYAKEGGMNKRKAGEDFYFLQKYLINRSIGEIKEATVYPSPRTSDRVPFGTGRSILDHQENRKDLQYTYSVQSFRLVKKIWESIQKSYPQLPQVGKEMEEFLGEGKWQQKWREINSQSKDWMAFEKRFFQWFTPFRLLKFIHFLRDQYYPNELLAEAVNELLKLKVKSEKEMLSILRERDKEV